MGKKFRTVCTTLNYIELFLVLAWLTNFSIRLKICAITTGIKKYKSTINKKEKKHD